VRQRGRKSGLKVRLFGEPAAFMLEFWAREP
jgi:hypothetical protein